MSLPENPTANSNYLVSNRILFGSYPTPPQSNGIFDSSIEAIVNIGCNVFVNAVPLDERRGEFNYVPYVKERVPDAIFIDYYIEDGGIPAEPKSFTALIQRLHALYKEGKRMYIHCVGGHGRSAVIAGCLLIHMDYQPDNVLEILSKAHEGREHPSVFSCPHTSKQSEFIRTYSPSV